jgi:hypothetical protein
MKRTILWFLSAGLLIWSSTSAIAGTVSCSETYSAVGQLALFSFDGKANANLSDVTGRSTCNNRSSSRYRLQGVAETIFSSTPCTFTGPKGNTENGILGTEVAGVAISTDPKTGDLLFTKDVLGTTCFNQSTSEFAITTNSTVTGGTGANAGATGTVTAHSLGSSLAAPSSPGFGDLAWATGTGTSTITVP